MSRLVSCIETDHSRSEAASVFDSLLAIHWAQIASLEQQSQQRILSHDTLLEMSIRKGGTSVLAHGYLINPSITEEEAKFFFGYGVFLQLLDDLQDVVRDKHCQHATLFTRVSRQREPLDLLTSRVYHFIQNVLQGISRFSPIASERIRELIEKNCALLMLESIARHFQQFSPEFRERMEFHSPFEFSFLRGSSARIQRRFLRAKQRFAKNHGNAPIYTVLG